MIEAAAIAALFVSPSTTARCGGAVGPSLNPSTSRASASSRSARDGAKPPEVAAVEAVAIDSRGGDHPDGELPRSGDHRAVETLTLLGLYLLGVVQGRERANAVPMEVLVVEQHARDHERPGERAAAGLICTGDTATSSFRSKRRSRCPDEVRTRRA